VSRCDWRAPLMGKEVYFKGLKSGKMGIHAAFAKGGKNAGKTANPTKRAKGGIPIMGGMRNNRTGRAKVFLASAWSAYFSARAPPSENPTIGKGFDGPLRLRASRTANRVAASQSSHSAVVRAAGTVPCAGSLMATAT